MAPYMTTMHRYFGIATPALPAGNRQFAVVRHQNVTVRVAAVSLLLLALGCTGSSGDQPAASPSATPSRTAVTDARHGLPALGAPGFPTSIYPASRHGKRAVRRCPNPDGLQIPGPQTRNAAITIAERFQTGSRNRELHAADRAIWPEIYTDAQGHTFGIARATHHFPVLSTGRLLGHYTGGGAPNPTDWIQHDCPPKVATRSFEVAIGPRNGPALDAVFVFVQRARRTLLYFVYP